MQPFITVISPVYKAEFIIEELVRRNKLVLSKISEKFEIILIDDCAMIILGQKFAKNLQKILE
jgi:glycosyltransferase involved in cell wall biosynthesis